MKQENVYTYSHIANNEYAILKSELLQNIIEEKCFGSSYSYLNFHAKSSTDFHFRVLHQQVLVVVVVVVITTTATLIIRSAATTVVVMID
jgi:hypothetical protein